MSTPENSTAATPRRRRKDADQPPADSAGTAEVVYLADSEAERLARTQGRIRTKTGKFLRPLTDLGNTERYSDSHGGDLLYVDESGRWRGYNGKHWADTTKDRELHTRLIEVARSIWAEAEQCRTSAETTEVRKHAKYSESKNGINAAKTLLSSEYAVSIRDFDPTGHQGDTLNLINGTLDLETFELRPHRKEDMLSKFAPVVYDPDATAPNWEAHLEWSIPDAGTRETVQRYFGYALTNETREQKMLCFYGAKGRNGKGVIVRAIERILGYDPQSNTSDDHAYAQAAPASLLMASKRSPDAPSGDLARLVGKRFVSLQETGQGQKFDEVRLKALTGGDAIPARFLHQDYFQFTPVAKYVLVTNHRPEVHGDDPALWRRLFLVNFPHSISDEEIDNAPDYEARIQAELSGILNWMLDGLRKWRESGLQISDAIRNDTNAYRREQDTFGAFVDECLEPAEGQLTKIGVVYAIYKEWAQDNGVGAFALPRFRRMLEPKIPGLYDKRTGNPPERYYGGLRLKESVKMDAFVGGRGHASNPVTRPDPSPPPGEHTQAWNLLRRSQTQQTETDATAAPAPEPAPVPEGLMSVSCQRGHHDECARDRAMGWLTGEECECGCHHGGAEILPLFEPQPDPADAPELTDEELDMLAQLHADTDEVAPEPEPEVEPEPTPEPAAEVEPEPAAEPERYSERAIRPWTVKPSAYADLQTGEAITDDRTVFSIAKRGKGIATLAELLRSVPKGIKFVHLTGAPIGTDGTVTAWANTRLPKGWERTDRGHDSDEARDRISLRYRRPDGTQLVVYRAAGWLGRDVEETTSPAALRDAFALLLRGIGETFGDVVGGDFGVPLKSTPAATGVTLMQRTLPRGKQYPILPAELQHLIRSHAGQARSEDFAAVTHPSRGAHVPDRIPGLYVWDMRFAYAAILDQELPCGPVIRDTTPEFARVGKGWELCLYRLRVTVPKGWDRVGRFRRRDGETDVWVYPNRPGETFETWAWERTVHAADRDGWRIGEHVEILERVRFTGPKTKPLATFGRHLRALRDEWIPAQSDVPEQVRELGRIMARQIAIAAIGKLAGTPYSKLRSCPIEALDARPADARRSDDGKRWEWREKVTSNDDLTHPEWAAYIWSTCRDWLYDHPKQPGVGLRHVLLPELIAARTDGYWTSTPQPVTDTGVVGHFRPQLQHNEPIDTPRTYADLNATRDALLAQEVTR
jgi:putative DNA primase/helicase